MRFNPTRHHRRSIRLPGFDYSQPGAYFITICVHEREPLLGSVVEGMMELSPAGELVQRVWEELPSHYPTMRAGPFVIMPNHLHAIISLVPPGTDAGDAVPMNAGNAVGARFIAPITGDAVGARFIAPITGDAVGARFIAPISVPMNAGDDGPGEGAMNRAPAVTGDAVPMNTGDAARTRSVPLGTAHAYPTTIGEIVRGFKARCTHALHVARLGKLGPIWQRNYHERIIRDDYAYARITQYILNNPRNWKLDLAFDDFEELDEP